MNDLFYTFLRISENSLPNEVMIGIYGQQYCLLAMKSDCDTTLRIFLICGEHKQHSLFRECFNPINFSSSNPRLICESIHDLGQLEHIQKEREPPDLVFVEGTILESAGSAVFAALDLELLSIPVIFLFDCETAESHRLEVSNRGFASFDINPLLPAEIRRWLLVLDQQKRRYEADLGQKKNEITDRLISGIGHDFNNYLATIRLSSELMMYRKDIPEEDYRHLQSIERECSRAVNFIKKLRLYGKKRELFLIPVELCNFINDIRHDVESVAGSDIKVSLKLPAMGFIKVKGDYNLLKSAVLQLVENARDSMPGGGDLTLALSLSKTPDADPPSNQDGLNCSSEAVISVCDTGRGIPQKDLDKVTTPFFSTMRAKGGFGLGLPTVVSLFEEHGGSVRILSREKKGTTIHCSLPVLEFGHYPKGSAGSNNHPVNKRLFDGSDKKFFQSDKIRRAVGSNRIMVVEDEDDLRSLVTFFLEKEGFEVIEATSGEEALDLWQESRSGKGIALVVSDVVLPGINGLDLADVLQKRDPGLKIILTSGYTRAMVSKDLDKRKNCLFIEKPFEPSRISRIIRNTINQH